MACPSVPLGRRAALKCLAFGGLAALSRVRVAGQVPGSAADFAAVTAYLESLARPDHGYAWDDQPLSHLTPTWAVIGTYRLLGRMPPARAELAAFVRTHHPRDLKKLEQERRIFDYQQVQALAWLEEDLAAFRPGIAACVKPLGYLRQYERQGYPVLQSELGAVQSHALAGLPTEGLVGPFGAYLDLRRRANGSFNNTPAADGGDGHVMNTWWALQAGRVLGRGVKARDELVAWLQACQLPGGGFTHAPAPAFGGVDDVAYTRAALRALQFLGAEPRRRAEAVAYLHSLANADGGFGDRPGWSSNASATYHALDALAALGELGSVPRMRRRPRPVPAAVPEGLGIYSIQIEAHGQGSPAEAVALARSLKIDLWGAKNARPEWLARARTLAAAEAVPVEFFVANEEYGTWVDVPGLGTYSHTSDIVAPAGADAGPSLAAGGPVSWPEFRTRRLDPLQRAGGRLAWQFGENEELVRMFLDDSVERGGFAMISTFHFGNPDFLNTEPFLNRWRGRIPFIALQDAHGPEPWWFADQSTGFRTLFLAKAPTWEGWLEALRRNWTVAVRRDVWTRGRTWLHAGSDAVRDHVLAREVEWRWWDNPAIRRPMVSLVALTPADTFEAGRPERGVALRVRCAWENTAQGLPKSPLTELERLVVDGRDVQPSLVERRRANGQREDHYHLLHVPSGVAPAVREATAVVREVGSGARHERTVRFHA